MTDPVTEAVGGRSAAGTRVGVPVQSPPLEHGLICRTTRLDGEADLLRLAGERGFVWRSPEHELIAKGAAARIRLPLGRGRLAAASAAVAEVLRSIRVESEVGDEDAPAAGPVAVGALPYDDGSPGELVIPAVVVHRTPDGSVFHTRVAAATNGDGAERPAGAGWRDGSGLAAEPSSPPVVTGIRPLQDEVAWKAMIEAALREIHAGRLGKVMLARELVVEADQPFTRAAVLRRLAGANGCFLYAQDRFVGASPELLVSRAGGIAVSVPLAGTVARGATPTEEAEQVRALEASAKDAAEHQFVVDAIVEALAPIARVTTYPREVLKFNTVAHLATRVEARLRDPVPSALDLVARLHPTPAVGGTPTAVALELQAALEGFDRGRYAGPVGWVDAAGDGEWAVALRGAELDGTSAILRAGVGVVAGSDPAAEWAEASAKFGAMLDALWPGGAERP